MPDVEWFPEPSVVPLIIDTDIGGEPDDAIALIVAAGLPSLSLVITSDEQGGQRARFARCLLDLIGRSDVPVVAGAELRHEDSWAAHELVPNYIPAQPSDVLAAVRRVLDQHDGQISWVGLGPMSNLAAVLAADPAFGERLIITQQEAAVKFSPDGGQRNFALDVDAVQRVLAAGAAPWIVPADVTFQLANSLSMDSLEFDLLEEGNDPAREILRDHLDQWFDNFAPFVTLHAVPTLALGIGMPYLGSISAAIGLDEAGRVIPGDASVHFVRTADYSRLRAWLVHRLELVQSNLDVHPASDHND
ncbi:nucleoside hydrolase [Nocardia pneumoniae]|uniref:nucleoside hydrolase n=1 Tax=Nocardia pneumoniae TaxID=228601 RepID=UPI0006867360|nr:nucleoside hydrolase [Nocardia pneumoniae]